MTTGDNGVEYGEPGRINGVNVHHKYTKKETRVHNTAVWKPIKLIWKKYRSVPATSGKAYFDNFANLVIVYAR
jgi:hypothetical protein